MFENLANLNKIEKLTIFINNNNLKNLCKLENQSLSEVSLFFEDNLIENIKDFTESINNIKKLEDL
jgi:hypothetical protein